MRAEDEYRGARVLLSARLGTAIVPVRIDIGFGDVVHPPPLTIDFPRLLDDMPAISIRAYPPETVIAEKFHAMIQYGETTSRLKDFYDLWAISRTFAFDKATLARAIARTFAQRKTRLPSETPSVLAPSFAEIPLKQDQWRGFLRRSPTNVAPPSFDRLLSDLRRSLVPVIAVLSAPGEASGTWAASDGWSG